MAMTILNYYLIQKEIYEKLIENSQLMAKVNGVFDYLPQNTDFPFITINGATGVDFSNLMKNGGEYGFVINIWSREAGNKQSAEIMELVYEILHNGNITVSGKNFVSMKITETSIKLEVDGITYHGEISLKILLMNS